MMKYVMMIVLLAMLAISGNPATAMVAGGTGAAARNRSVGQGNSYLAKTWTTRGQENEAGSQVLVVSALTSHGSF